MLHKILFIAGKTENKNATAEHRQLTERIKAATQRDNLAMREVFDATIEDILQTEAQFQPTIFHFIGDGTAQGLSIFNNNTALKSFFTQRKERIEIAFFNADHSATQARLVSELGIYAIGMNGRISKQAAIRFSTGFYLGLGEGKSVENAFEDGMIIIEAEFPNEKHIPMLWKGGEKMSEEIAPFFPIFKKGTLFLLVASTIGLIAFYIYKQPVPKEKSPAQTVSTVQDTPKIKEKPPEAKPSAPTKPLIPPNTQTPIPAPKPTPVKPVTDTPLPITLHTIRVLYPKALENVEGKPILYIDGKERVNDKNFAADITIEVGEHLFSVEYQHQKYSKTILINGSTTQIQL